MQRPRVWQTVNNEALCSEVRAPVSLCVSSAMDLSFVQEIMCNTIQAARILRVDADRVAVWQSILDRLQPLRVGSDGRLLEWDKEHTEGEPGHRHLSHLYGAFPGGFINERRTPELFEAAKKSYDYRLEPVLVCQSGCPVRPQRGCL